MLHVCTPLLEGNEEKYVLDCLRRNEISSGGYYLDQIETSFSRYCGAKFAIATTNGTTALQLAVAAMDIGPGDEVIMPTLTIISTALAAIYCGAKPVFVDVEPDTWNINPQLIEAKITKKTKAIIPVHMYGHPCDMDAIKRIAKKYKLLILEDAAEAHGAKYKKQTVGGIGDASVFSFYANKIITSGEGGMVVTSNAKIAERCRYLKNLGFKKEKRFWHEDLGFNFRMTNLQAALLLAQFERIESLTESRRKNARLYNSLLIDVPGITLPVERPDSRNAYWMYSILIGKEFGFNRDDLMKILYEKGIETRTFFIPMNQQPVLKKMKLVTKDRYPVADRIAKEGMYLPSGSGLKPDEIKFVCETIKKIRK